MQTQYDGAYTSSVDKTALSGQTDRNAGETIKVLSWLSEP